MGRPEEGLSRSHRPKKLLQTEAFPRRPFRQDTR
jgi:hypothetical protein